MTSGSGCPTALAAGHNPHEGSLSPSFAFLVSFPCILFLPKSSRIGFCLVGTPSGAVLKNCWVNIIGIGKLTKDNLFFSSGVKN